MSRKFDVVEVRDEDLGGELGVCRIVSLIDANGLFEVDLVRTAAGAISFTNEDGLDMEKLVSKTSKALALAALDA